MAFFFTCFTSIKLRRKRNLERVAAINTPTMAPQEEEEDDDDDYDHRNRTILGRLSWDQIHMYTSNFSSLIGSGGFSNVYLAQFPGFGIAAVKIHGGSSERLSGIYKQELQILRGLRHDHIVKLLGYCDDREEGVLVFEYVPNGNLQEKLHGSNKGNLLSWRSRVKIAFQLAQALEYLHHQCPLQIVHGDIKASNILLDRNLDCKLCDFGSAKMGFSSAMLPPQSSSSHNQRRMMIMGSPGYTDPHYMWTGIASKKNDIYSFGVILLELITGMEALNPISGERLATVVGPMSRDPSKVAQILDARLLAQDRGGFDLEEVKAMACISAICLGETPSLRPSASDIVNLMRNNIQVPSRVSFSLSKVNKQL